MENLLRPLKFWQRGRASYSTAETVEEPEMQVAALTRSGKQPVQVGNVTECALLMFSMSLGLEPEATRAANPVESFVKVRGGVLRDTPGQRFSSALSVLIAAVLSVFSVHLTLSNVLCM